MAKNTISKKEREAIEKTDSHVIKFVDDGYFTLVKGKNETKLNNDRPEKKKAHLNESAMRSVETANNDLFFMLKFRDIPTIRRWQAHAQEAIQDPDVDWEKVNNFHVTLVYVPEISRMDTFELTMGVDVISAVPVVIEGFGTFSTERGDPSNVLFLAVKKTEELAEVQARLFDFVKGLGFDTSPFSTPEDWTPHITLGTSETPFDETEFPDVGGAAISASDVEASVDFKAIAISEKFNPYHDELGRFTTTTGAMTTISEFNERLIDAKRDYIDEVENNSEFMRYRERFTEDSDVSIDTIESLITDHVENQVRDARVIIRIDPLDLESVLDDERFKSQHESNQSRGYLNPDWREEAENAVWGEDTYRNVEHRPIYGYLSNDNNNDPGSVLRYGSAQVILKRENIEDRTTFTVGDSLGIIDQRVAIPMPLNAPDHRAVGGEPVGLGDRNNIFKITPNDPGFFSYWEVQIHGGVTLDDISVINFTGRVDPTLLRRLDELGISHLES